MLGQGHRSDLNEDPIQPAAVDYVVERVLGGADEVKDLLEKKILTKECLIKKTEGLAQ